MSMYKGSKAVGFSRVLFSLFYTAFKFLIKKIIYIYFTFLEFLFSKVTTFFPKKEVFVKVTLIIIIKLNDY